MDDVFWHPSVDLASQLDESRVLIKLTRFPCEIEWVDRNAVASQTGPRIKRHKSKRLGLRRFDHFPNIDAHGGVNHLEFVNQRDINAPKNVLEQLSCFPGATGRNRHKCINCFTIKRHSALQACRRVTAYDPRDQFHVALFVSRILSFRRKSEME